MDKKDWATKVMLGVIGVQVVVLAYVVFLWEPHCPPAPEPIEIVKPHAPRPHAMMPECLINDKRVYDVGNDWKWVQQRAVVVDRHNRVYINTLARVYDYHTTDRVADNYGYVLEDNPVGVKRTEKGYVIKLLEDKTVGFCKHPGWSRAVDGLPKTFGQEYEPVVEIQYEKEKR